MEVPLKNNDTRGDVAPLRRSDPEPLVESLRENTGRRIEELNSAADRDMERIDTEIRKEVEDFTEAQRSRCEEIIKYEGARLRNLASTAMKKQRLEGIETFINIIMDDAAVSVRGDTGYIDLLKNCIKTGLDNVRGAAATIIVSADDLSYSGAITDMASAAGYKFRTAIKSDSSLKMGGAMVIDDELEVVYNNTVERMLYRKKDMIRREIVRSLEEAGVYKDG